MTEHHYNVVNLTMLECESYDQVEVYRFNETKGCRNTLSSHIYM